MGSRILLLDASDRDGPDLSAQLASSGFVVQIARELDHTLRLAQDKIALIIVRAAPADAAQYCGAIRAVSDRPIVFVCEAPDENVIVDSLEAGADSVVVSPLSRRELEARIRAWLERPERFRPSAGGHHVRSVGDLVIDSENHVVTKAGRSISLTPTEFRLLASLARRAGSTVSHQDLLADVWGAARFGSEHLRLYVRYLRRKLENDHRHPQLLLNRRGVGYRLVAGATGVQEGPS